MPKQTKQPTKTAIKKEIIDFLNASSAQVNPRPGRHSCGLVHKNALVLATYANNKPRATVLEFFNEGLSIYIFGEPGGKIANIKRNSSVSAIVYEQPLNHAKNQRSLQIFGEAELISVRNNSRLYWAKVRKWNLQTVGKRLFSPMFKGMKLSEKETDAMVKKGLAALNLIKITPDHIILKKWKTDFSVEKLEWKK